MEHGVHQGGLAVVHVGDDGQVSNVVAGMCGHDLDPDRKWLQVGRKMCESPGGARVERQ